MMSSTKRTCPAVQRFVEVLGQVDHTAGLFAGAIAGDGQEVNCHRNGDGAQQIGHEEEHPFENPDHHQVLPGIVLADLGAQPVHGLLNLLFV